VSAAVEARATCRGCGAQIEPGTGNRKREWCSDRCRKRTLYSQPCLDCGKPTNGSDGRRDEPRCLRCAAVKAGAEKTIWTRDAILAAIHAWADVYGEPPAAPDWRPNNARNQLHDDARARRFEDANGRWSWADTAIREFGSWNAAIAAAGYEPRPSHGGGENVARRRNQRDPSRCGPSDSAEPESAERSPDPPAGEESP
jgi:hypothetical protein